MIDRKALKRSAWKNLKAHYVLLVFLCAIAILWGTEFNGVIKNAQTLYDMLTGRQTQVNLGSLYDDGSLTTKAVADVLIGNLGKGDAESAESMRQMQAAADPNSALGRQRGVLAAAMNYIYSGRLFAMAGMALFRIFQSEHIASAY